MACFVSCGWRNASKQSKTPVRYGYKIVNTYPHDAEAYTQGLFRHEGALYESTGEYGWSTLRRVELETGRVTQKIDLPDDYFAEGATILDGKIYQQTWLEEKVFVYDAATFEKVGEFSLEKREEGWGITTDGERLYTSDGTANIAVRNPADFSVLRKMVIRNEGRPVQYINELEWIDGKIWANVWMTREIVIIDPADGRVEGVIDFTGIERALDIRPTTDVMNGIAYDPATKRIFVTGKNWNKLFEIEIFKN